MKKGILILFIMIFSLSSYSQLNGWFFVNTEADLLTGLISVYDFNQVPDQYELEDQYGSNDFPFSGAPTVYPTQAQSGILSYSYSFGSTTILKRTTIDANLMAFHTISVWVKRTNNSSDGQIVSNYYGGYVSQNHYNIMLKSNGSSNAIVCEYRDDSGVNLSLSYYPGSDIWQNNWVHIVYVIGNNYQYIYINGTKEATGINGDGDVNVRTVADPDRIGYREDENGVPTNHFIGNIDQLIYWSIELTQTQITRLVKGGYGLAYVNW